MRGTTGKNNSDLTEMNRSAIVKILQQTEVCSRADIAKKTGLTRAAITKIVAELIKKDIVTELGLIQGDGNRRSIGLQLNAAKHQVIGVKFSRKLFAVGVFDISGKVYTQKETKYSSKDASKTVVSAIKKQIHDLLDAYENVVAIGFAVPGPYLRKEGYIAVITRMPTWHDINFIEEFKEEFDKPVFIEHDANAGALAEWWFGNHSPSPHTLAYFLVGEGVGAGVVDNGKMLLGAQGVASEIGHISVDVNGARCECGNYGCLEMYCSAYAMVELANKRNLVYNQDTSLNHSEICRILFDKARKGDKDAMEVVQEVATYMAYGCMMIMTAYNPDVITIGDLIAEGGDLLLPTIQKVIKERAIPELYNNVRIELSHLAVDATLYGAAAIATDKVLELPSAFSAPRDEHEAAE